MNAFKRCACGAALALSSILLFAGVGAADTVTDDFSSGSIDPNKWFLPPFTQGSAALTQTGGRLEFTASGNVGDGQAQAGLLSKGVGLQTANFFAQARITLDGGNPPFPSLGAGNVVGLALAVDPGATGGDDSYQVALGYVSGFGFALRQETKSNGTVTYTMDSLGNTSPKELFLRIEFDATTKALQALYDAGSGFTAVGSSVDITDWNIDPTETLGIYFFAVAGNASGDPATAAFAVTSGQARIDDFTAEGVAIIPEPALGAPLALLSLALIRATARRVRAARR